MRWGEERIQLLFKIKLTRQNNNWMDHPSFSNNRFLLALLMWKTCVGTEMSYKHQWVCWRRKEIYIIQLIKYKLGMFKRTNKLVFQLKLYVWYINYVSCSTSLKYRFDKLVCTGTKEILMSPKLKTFRNKLSWFSHKYEPDTFYLFSCLPSFWATFW